MRNISDCTGRLTNLTVSKSRAFVLLMMIEKRKEFVYPSFSSNTSNLNHILKFKIRVFREFRPCAQKGNLILT